MLRPADIIDPITDAKKMSVVRKYGVELLVIFGILALISSSIMIFYLVRALVHLNEQSLSITNSLLSVVKENTESTVSGNAARKELMEFLGEIKQLLIDFKLTFYKPNFK